jgi:hypothetical protein
VRRTCLAIGFGILLSLLARGNALAATTVCVLTPRLAVNTNGEVVAPVPIASPTLLSTDLLEEVRIEGEGELLWQRQAQPDQPIEGPIPWPLEPIRPGQRLRLMLRPHGGAPDDYAVIVLEGEPAERMGRAQAERDRLGDDPQAWWETIQRAFDRGDMSLGLALLFAFEGPSSPRLDNLRRAVFLAGCGDAGGGSPSTPGWVGTAGLRRGWTLRDGGTAAGCHPERKGSLPCPPRPLPPAIATPLRP